MRRRAPRFVASYGDAEKGEMAGLSCWTFLSWTLFLVLRDLFYWYDTCMLIIYYRDIRG